MNGPEALTDYKALHERDGRIIDALLEVIGTNGVTLDTFRTDMRPPATVTREANQYDVRKGNLGS